MNQTSRRSFAAPTSSLRLTTAIAFLALLSATGVLQAQEATAAGEPALNPYELGHGWFTRDKAYHVTVAAAGAAGLYVLGREAGLRRGTSAALAAGTVTAAGLLRELSSSSPDPRQPRTNLSRKDLAWNSVGIVLGIAVSDRILADRWRGRRGDP